MASRPRKTRTKTKATHRKPARRRPGSASPKDALPSREDILKFISESPQKVGKREITRAFGIKGGGRIALKRLLAEMAQEGLISGGRKALRRIGVLPPVAVIEITRRDEDGDLIGRPAAWDDAEGERPEVLILTHLVQHRPDLAELTIGDRVLAQITELEEEDVEGFRFEAEPLKRLPREVRRLLGIFRSTARGGIIQPIDRRILKDWPVQRSDINGASDGDLVRFAPVPRGRFTAPHATVLEVLGNPEEQRQISLIAIHAHGLPHDFPESVLAEAERLPPPDPNNRADLTGLPLLTIDPSDARDHDDAVHAEPDTDPRNPGGFIVTVAIADVAHYVRPGSKLDREAMLRGNSVYFPDRVVPMLPEKISNDLCSLREGQDRPCIAVRMVFDNRGEKKSHTFLRATMRAAANLSYEEAQAAIDGNPNAKCKPLLETALLPLWAAYEKLSGARARRGPLELELPERKVLINSEGRVDRVIVPERLAAHRLIEEFMIQANVSAAEALEERRAPVVYRIHEPPSPEKLKALRDFLDSLNLKLPGEVLRPAAFNRVLERARELPILDLVNEVILRSQSQAEYNTVNVGHFGLNLRRYAHFTSPIRRYADVLVHRSLISAYRLGAGGLRDDQAPANLASIAKQISEAERRAMAAERETVDRLIAAHLADRIGAVFEARISGVTRFGLFVRLRDIGADGFVPASSLLGEYYQHVETLHTLVGQRTGRSFHLGDDVEVRLVEAVPTAGALRFEMISEPKAGAVRLPKGFKTGRGLGRKRPSRPRH